MFLMRDDGHASSYIAKSFWAEMKLRGNSKKTCDSTDVASCGWSYCCGREDD